MSLMYSLKQIWTTLIIFSTVIPVTIVLIVFTKSSFESQLDLALQSVNHKHEILRNNLESEIRGFEALLKNKSDPLSLLIDNHEQQDKKRNIYELLNLMVLREDAIRKVMIISATGKVIAAIDPDLGIDSYSNSTIDKLQFATEHLRSVGFQNTPTVVVPMTNRVYMGTPKKHNEYYGFSISVPIGNPAKMVLVAIIDMDKLWSVSIDSLKVLGKSEDNYMLDRHGALITLVNNSNYKVGELMAHLKISRTAQIKKPSLEREVFVGINKTEVYGTITNISKLNWTLISEVPVSKIKAPIYKSLYIITSTALLILIIFILSILFLVRKTLRPIENASNAMASLEKGEFGMFLEPTRIKELYVLTNGFIQMSKAIFETEVALQESEHDLLITLDSIAEGVIVCDDKGIITRMNPVAEALTGWSITEAKNHKIDVVFSVINSETREHIQNPFEQILESKKIVYREKYTKLISKKGQEYYIRNSAAPLFDDMGRILGMVLVFNDTSEDYQLRQEIIQSEERFRQLAEHIDEIFWISSPLGDEIYYISPSFEKIWGIDAEELYRNPKLWFESIIPEDRTKVLRELPKTITSEYKSLYRIKRADGKILSIKAKAFPVYNSKNEIVRVVGVSEDITDNVNLEKSLQRTQKMEALGKLTGGIAHDYNNMLGVIMGYAQLLELGLDKESKFGMYAQEISRAGERGAKLTKKLLSFSQQNLTEVSQIDIGELLFEQQDMLSKTLTVRVELTIKSKNNNWLVNLDKMALEDAILNMCINSMHAMQKNNALHKLTITVEDVVLKPNESKVLELKPGEHVVLKIKDSGIGMDKITQHSIFDPFFTTKGTDGTGLGLSQVFGFVNRSQGAIDVESTLGDGSEFKLYFPRCLEPMSQDDTQLLVSNVISKGSESILVVDDEKGLRNLTYELLTQQGYKVYSVSSGAEALKLLGQVPIDLLLSDVIMPEMDGFQLACKVKSQYPHIKIQMVSGFSDNRHEKSQKKEYDNILLKPYQTETLFKSIRILLDSD